MAHRPHTRLALALIAALAAAALGLVTASAADHEPPAKPASKLSGPLVVLLQAFEEIPGPAAGYAAALADTDSPSAADQVNRGMCRSETLSVRAASTYCGALGRGVE